MHKLVPVSKESKRLSCDFSFIRHSPDVPLDSSPWQKREGARFSHIAYRRPPRSYSGCLDCPWLIGQRCILDAAMDYIQHPIRDSAETKTRKKNWQIHTQTRCALSSFSCQPRSPQVPLTHSERLIDQKHRQGAHSPPQKLRHFDYWPRLPNINVRDTSLNAS